MHRSHLLRLWNLVFLLNSRSDLGPHIGANPLIPGDCNRVVAVETFR